MERYIELLTNLISIPSLSREEQTVADHTLSWLKNQKVDAHRVGNNIYATSTNIDPGKPWLLLNSHLDTVKPSDAYTRNPYKAEIVQTSDGERIYGLGSNDAGASVVALTETFLNLKDSELPFNLLLALTSEEEVGGEGGIRKLLPHLADIGITPSAGIIGEPTGMQPAVAERGLVVLDAETRGIAGHAARKEGINAIYLAIDDIRSILECKWPRESEILGPASVAVTQINAGKAHNIVPDVCRWVVDIRTTDAMKNEEVVDFLRSRVNHSLLTPRSTRIRASVISDSHPLVTACKNLGLQPFVSPTTSDMSLMPDFPTLKIGPGESSRSHSADEFVFSHEIASAVDIYAKILTNLEFI